MIFIVVLLPILLVCSIFDKRNDYLRSKSNNHEQETSTTLEPGCTRPQSSISRKDSTEREYIGQTFLVDSSLSLRRTLDLEKTKVSYPPPKRKEDWLTFQVLVKKHQINWLYHFTDESNIPTIISTGGLFSLSYCRSHNIRIPCPGGNGISRINDEIKNLLDYIHLCFNFNQPMLHVARREGRIKNPAILKVSSEVIYWGKTKFSNLNAADASAMIGEGFEDFDRIDLKLAISDSWSGPDEKKRYQAEVMVKEHIPLDYITFQ